MLHKQRMLNIKREWARKIEGEKERPEVESRKEQKPILLNRFSVKNLQLCGFRADYNASEYYDLFFVAVVIDVDATLRGILFLPKVLTIDLSMLICVTICTIYMCEIECHRKKTLWMTSSGRIFRKLNNTRTMHKICAMWVEYNRFATKWAIFVWRFFRFAFIGRACEFSLRIETMWLRLFI